ncbi:hypothetical protein STANM309S_02920 [Streptomyces tanashiensis]
MRVEKAERAYESPVANIVQDSMCPEAETLARLGMPGRLMRRTSRSRSSSTRTYERAGTPGRRWRQRAVEPAAWKRSQEGPPATRPPGAAGSTRATRPLAASRT